MIKVKLFQLLNSAEIPKGSKENDLQFLFHSKLRISIQSRMIEIMREVQLHLEDYEKVRLSKIEEYGKVMAKDDGDRTPQTPKDAKKVTGKNLEIFMKEITEAQNREIELKVNKIKIADLKNSKGEEIDIDGDSLVRLKSWLLEE